MACNGSHQRATYNADDDLVFCHPDIETVLDHSALVRRFKRALVAGGVREVRFHDLRHTFGTRMASVGVPMRTLQEWMGHATSRQHSARLEPRPPPRAGAR